MSGWHPGIAIYDDLPLPIRGPAVTSQRIDAHDLDRRGVRQPLTQDGNNADPAPSDGDRGSEYGSEDQRATPTTLPGLPGLPPGPYVVVLETKDPHQTLATAQELPGPSLLRRRRHDWLRGSHRPVPFDPQCRSGAVGLRTRVGSVGPVGPDATPALRWVGPRAGRVVGRRSGTPSLHAELGGLPAGSTLYFGITAGNSERARRAIRDDRLSVMDQRPVDADELDDRYERRDYRPHFGDRACDRFATVSLDQPRGSCHQRGDSQAAPTSPPNERDGVRVAVGSPAMRSARPSGGLLSDGDPAPPAARDFNAAVNKEWDERSLTGPTPRQRKRA